MGLPEYSPFASADDRLEAGDITDDMLETFARHCLTSDADVLRDALGPGPENYTVRRVSHMEKDIKLEAYDDDQALYQELIWDFQKGTN